MPLKINSEITAEYFTVAVGRPPEKDDLERCNCTKNDGIKEHIHCGWNYTANLPCFMNRGTPEDRIPKSVAGFPPYGNTAYNLSEFDVATKAIQESLQPKSKHISDLLQ